MALASIASVAVLVSLMFARRASTGPVMAAICIAGHGCPHRPIVVGLHQVRLPGADERNVAELPGLDVCRAPDVRPATVDQVVPEKPPGLGPVARLLQREARDVFDLAAQVPVAAR